MAFDLCFGVRAAWGLPTPVISRSTAHTYCRKLHASKSNANLTVMGYSCSFIKYDLKLDNRKKLVEDTSSCTIQKFLLQQESRCWLYLIYSEPDKWVIYYVHLKLWTFENKYCHYQHYDLLSSRRGITMVLSLLQTLYWNSITILAHF